MNARALARPARENPGQQRFWSTDLYRYSNSLNQEVAAFLAEVKAP